ncbi:MAG: 4-(cytidine 5'-diphospho)-2-C-methyl-D-erythritol kinase [Dehalococcoidia bacterium]|nr:4-(cytidine 5'-diphospho)-2-C-methyl-D-erythritol kinase [Dehalococcoidia bacterium]
MSEPLRLRAPAKVNWTLEVLARRSDGYHELRTILQTIALSDWVTLTPADELSLEFIGEPSSLAGEAPEVNLAYRAADLLRHAVKRPPRGPASRAPGVRIELEKRIPVAAGLGGGSSDAAAVLRGLRQLWRLKASDHDLASLAAEVGADVPFFLRGGAALGSGRGEELSFLPDAAPRRLVFAWLEPSRPLEKTALAYSQVRPPHYSDGSRTNRLAERLRSGHPIGEGDLWNVFEQVLPQVHVESSRAFEQAARLGVPHLAGSGPAFYFLLDGDQPAQPLLDGLAALGLRTMETTTLPAAEAVTVETV